MQPGWAATRTRTSRASRNFDPRVWGRLPLDFPPDFAERSASRHRIAGVIAREARSKAGVRTGRLLERERELEALAAAITAAADGTAGLVLVEGPAGIGKSRLLVEARMLAEEREMGVRSARGGELELDFPFGI